MKKKSNINKDRLIALRIPKRWYQLIEDKSKKNDMRVSEYLRDIIKEKIGIKT